MESWWWAIIWEREREREMKHLSLDSPVVVSAPRCLSQIARSVTKHAWRSRSQMRTWFRQFWFCQQDLKALHLEDNANTVQSWTLSRSQSKIKIPWSQGGRGDLGGGKGTDEASLETRMLDMCWDTITATTGHWWAGARSELQGCTCGSLTSPWRNTTETHH